MISDELRRWLAVLDLLVRRLHGPCVRARRMPETAR